MTTPLLEKAKLFADLHTQDGLFVMPNAAGAVHPRALAFPTGTH